MVFGESNEVGGRVTHQSQAGSCLASQTVNVGANSYTVQRTTPLEVLFQSLW